SVFPEPLFIQLFYLNLSLSTEIPDFTRSPMVGETFTYWCDYRSQTAYNYKFICKGEDPSVCERLVSTQPNKMNNGKFSLNDDTLKRNITITVSAVTADDAGTYWCGAKSFNKERSNPFFHRFIMTVGESCYFIVWMKSDPGSDCRRLTDGWINSPVAVTIAVTCVAVLVLVVVVVVLIVYKRKIFFNSLHNMKHTHSHELTSLWKDYVYEEIQKCLPKPDTGNAMNSIYVTGNFPTNPSASLHYSTINFQKSSDKAGGEALVPKPRSSACEYSTVKIIRSPTHSTVVQPSTSTEDALYSTLTRDPGEKK
uniref:Immunoglobulin V-set domain-containing protein n=1 Tax=Seriola lalandi dorsalis TaxID=1841481 RepID=A0A3B4WVF6_SERLL